MAIFSMKYDQLVKRIQASTLSRTLSLTAKKASLGGRPGVGLSPYYNPNIQAALNRSGISFGFSRPRPELEAALTETAASLPNLGTYIPYGGVLPGTAAAKIGRAPSPGAGANLTFKSAPARSIRSFIGPGANVPIGYGLPLSAVGKDGFSLTNVIQAADFQLKASQAGTVFDLPTRTLKGYSTNLGKLSSIIPESTKSVLSMGGVSAAVISLPYQQQITAVSSATQILKGTQLSVMPEMANIGADIRFREQASLPMPIDINPQIFEPTPVIRGGGFTESLAIPVPRLSLQPGKVETTAGNIYSSAIKSLAGQFKPEGVVEKFRMPKTKAFSFKTTPYYSPRPTLLRR